jgi:hypothetical protein
MAKHFSQVIVESDGEKATITIHCQQCEGGSFTIASAHLETIARVLPDIARRAGYDLDPARTETHVFDAENAEEAKAKADAFFGPFVERRKAAAKKEH